MEWIHCSDVGLRNFRVECLCHEQLIQGDDVRCKYIADGGDSEKSANSGKSPPATKPSLIGAWIVIFALGLIGGSHDESRMALAEVMRLCITA